MTHDFFFSRLNHKSKSIYFLSEISKIQHVARSWEQELVTIHRRRFMSWTKWFPVKYESVIFSFLHRAWKSFNYISEVQRYTYRLHMCFQCLNIFSTFNEAVDVGLGSSRSGLWNICSSTCLHKSRENSCIMGVIEFSYKEQFSSLRKKKVFHC